MSRKRNLDRRLLQTCLTVIAVVLLLFTSVGCGTVPQSQRPTPTPLATPSPSAALTPTSTPMPLPTTTAGPRPTATPRPRPTPTATLPPPPAPPAACIPAPGVQPVSPTVVAYGAGSKRQVSLTFDSDNGSLGNAVQYLNILQNHQIRATWFLTGMFARANPAVVRRILAQGNDIGNHTMDHADLISPPRTDAFICNELNQADQLIAAADGRSSRPFFRPPYGRYSDQVRYLAARLGYRTVYWSIDPRDWDSATTTLDILNSVLNSPNLKPGAIILMHVNSPNEQFALDGVITGLQQRGYAIVPLSQLLQG